MSAKLFTKSELENLSVISLPKAYQRADQIPLDPTTVFTSYSDAEAYAAGLNVQYGDVAYVGQLVSVANLNGVTVYKIGIGGVLEPLTEVAKSSISAQNYTEATQFASSGNIGQIINVIQQETISGETYSNGLYIVTGEGSVSKLGVSSATDDIGGDVETLKARVSALESLTENLYWQTDEE